MIEKKAGSSETSMYFKQPTLHHIIQDTYLHVFGLICIVKSHARLT